jgi:hypothetical protein
VPEPTGGGSLVGGSPGPAPAPVISAPASSLTSPAVDRHSPVLQLGGPRRQRLTRRGLLVRARCSEPCSLRALGELELARAGRPIRLRQVLRRLAAGRAVSVRLKLVRGSRAAAGRSLALGRRVTARVVVRVRDADGNLRVGRRSIRLLR